MSGPLHVFRVPVDTGDEQSAVYEISADSLSDAAVQAMLLHKSLYPKSWHGAMVSHGTICEILGPLAGAPHGGARLVAASKVASAAALAAAQNPNVIDLAARRAAKLSGG